jgi:hypothetical protein
MKYNFEIPTTRAAAASAILAGAVISIAAGLFLTRQIVDAQYLELGAKTTQIEALQRRVKLPVVAAPASSDEAVFLEGANYALAANTLQQHTVEMIEQSGGKLVSVSVETPAATEQTSRRVIVQTRSELDNDGLQSLLYGLESGRPLVMIDSLNIRRAAQADNLKLDAKQSPRLTVELRVVGFYRKAAK